MSNLSWLYAIAIVPFMLTTPSHAEADGPDFWDVSGVRSNDVLHMHAEANARSRTIADIPHDASGLKNLGCSGMPTFQQYMTMTDTERARAARARWCKVEHGGKSGWVAGRFLKEGRTPRQADGNASRQIGAWTLTCQQGCALEQTGLGTTRRTLLRLEARDGGNAQIIIQRKGMPSKGVLSIYMDGDMISEGPVAPLVKGKDSLVMSADDITLRLVREMPRHKNMVLGFPGEERGVEIHLDGFNEAFETLTKHSLR